MPITVEWDTTLENTLYWEFLGRWTWAEFFEAFAKEEALVKESGYIRHDAMSQFENSHIPLGNAVGTVRNALQKRKNRGTFGLTIIRTDSMFVVTMMNVLKRTSPEFNKNFIAVITFEEGYDLIRQSRAKIDSDDLQIDVT